MKIKEFQYERANSIEEASELLHNNPDAVVMSGGTDLLGTLKAENLIQNPGMIVDLKGISNLNDVDVKENSIEVGALTTLTTISDNPDIQKKTPIVSEAAHSIATPLIRNKGTIGGNLCQDVRCWFYRYPEEGGGRLPCRRKGGDICYAIHGDNRYHSVFGGVKMGDATSCKDNCPAGTDIPAYMEQIRMGNWAGAAQIIMRVNPLPVITSRVCPHPCQDHCGQTCATCGLGEQECVSIRNVERAVGDYIMDHAEEYYVAPEKETGKRIAIVGSGPAGLSAAYYLRKSGHAVTVYDSKEEPGGMLMYAIPGYRLSKDKVRSVIKAYKKMGISFICNSQVGSDIDPNKLEDEYDCVYYATGTWKRPVLGISGEELTEFGLDFLVQVKEWMNGKIGQDVFVSGGGEVAMDVAMTAKRLGAKNVTLACLESLDEMPGKADLPRAREDGIKIMPSWGLSRVVEKDGKLVGMELKRCTSVRDVNGRFNPQYDENEKTVVEADNILMAVGQRVDLNFLSDKYQLQLTKRGLVDVDETTKMTSRKGVFAGGDVTTGPTLVIKCIANGHTAALGINKYLGVPNPDHECVSKQIITPFLHYDNDGVLNLHGLKLNEVERSKRNLDNEDEIPPTLEDAAEEAKRCMDCGCYCVNPSDLAPALMAIDATIRTNKRDISANDFCTTNSKVTEFLDKDEFITSISLPILKGAEMHYDKFRVRESVDFAIVSLASVFSKENGHVSRSKFVLGGVAPMPIRINEVERYISGKEITDEIAEKGGEIAVKHCAPLSHNAYKVNIIKSLVKDAILRMK